MTEQFYERDDVGINEAPEWFCERDDVGVVFAWPRIISAAICTKSVILFKITSKGKPQRDDVGISIAPERFCRRQKQELVRVAIEWFWRSQKRELVLRA